MPYFLVEGKSIYEKLYEPKFHLIIFSDGKSDFQELKTKFQNKYQQLVDIRIISLYPQVAEIFGAKKSFSVPVRPDNHIGYISMENSPHELSAYLKEFIRCS